MATDEEDRRKAKLRKEYKKALDAGEIKQELSKGIEEAEENPRTPREQASPEEGEEDQEEFLPQPQGQRGSASRSSRPPSSSEFESIEIEQPKTPPVPPQSPEHETEHETAESTVTTTTTVTKHQAFAEDSGSLKCR